MGNVGKLVIVGLACAGGLGSWVLSTGDGRTPGGDAVMVANGETPAQVGVPSRSGPAIEGENPLFRIEPAETALDPRDDSVPVTISRQAALAAEQVGSMDITLPDGTRYSVRHERSETAPDGNLTVIGRVDTTLGAMASVLTFGEGAVFGTLPTPTGEMMKLTTRAGQAYLQPAGFLVPPGVDPSLHPDYVVEELRPGGGQGGSVTLPATGTAASRHGSQAAQLGPPVDAYATSAAEEVTITMLAAYTRNLAQLRGSRAAVETEYRNLVAVMNQAHIDSDTIARFEIAGFVEVNYPATRFNDEAREDIIDNTLPDGTNLHALRDQHAADLVTLIRPYVEGDLTCGISQFPGNELQSRGFDGKAGYSVSAVESCRPLVLAHEVGHSLGLMHDRDTVAGPHGSTLYYGVFPFAFGHRQLGPPGFATVMGYDSESRPWLGYFSRPGTSQCSGAPCGDGALADNVRSINLIAEAISRFRIPAGAIYIDDAWVDEGGIASVHVKLSSPAPAGGVTFDLEHAGGSATAGVDFPGAYLPRKDIVIAAGSSEAWVQLPTNANSAVEPVETVNLRIRNVRGGATVLDDEGIVTILDPANTVRVTGNVRFPAGAARPSSFHVNVEQVIEGAARPVNGVWAVPPDYSFAFDVRKGAFVRINDEAPQVTPHVGPRMEAQVQASMAGGLLVQDVIVEAADHPVDTDLRLRNQVRVFGRLSADTGQRVTGVPVILWNPLGDGSGYYVNWLSGSYIPPYEMDVLSGSAMQLEVRYPPWPFVRQVVEIPPLSGDSGQDIQLRQVPSLTIPHVSVIEGTAAEGSRTILLTASLSVPRTKTGVTFNIQRRGTADGHDATLPKTSFTIPKDRSRIEVPVIIHGDDLPEGDEVLELRIVNVQGAAWNPGPGSVRILTDDDRPEGGSCSAPVDEGAMRMCQ